MTIMAVLLGDCPNALAVQKILLDDSVRKKSINL
jgi:hypothetical protein